MDWTLSEIGSAARAKQVQFPPEIVGYAALALAESMRRAPARFSLRDARLLPEGAVVAGGTDSSEEMACVCLGACLTELLPTASSAHRDLSQLAGEVPTSFAAFTDALQRALVPLNRAAAKRQLARLSREMTRVFPRGVVPAASETPSAPVSQAGNLVQHLAQRSPAVQQIFAVPGTAAVRRETTPAAQEIPAVHATFGVEELPELVSWDAGTPTTADTTIAERMNGGEDLDALSDMEQTPVVVAERTIRVEEFLASQRMGAASVLVTELVESDETDAELAERADSGTVTTVFPAAVVAPTVGTLGRSLLNLSRARRLANEFRAQGDCDERAMSRNLIELVGLRGEPGSGALEREAQALKFPQ